MELRTVCFKGNKNELFKIAGKIREDIFLFEQGFSVEYDDIDKDAYHVIVFDEKKPIATSRFYATSANSPPDARITHSPCPTSNTSTSNALR